MTTIALYPKIEGNSVTPDFMLKHLLPELKVITLDPMLNCVEGDSVP